jgi:hypothetical protein
MLLSTSTDACHDYGEQQETTWSRLVVSAACARYMARCNYMDHWERVLMVLAQEGASNLSGILISRLKNAKKALSDADSAIVTFKAELAAGYNGLTIETLQERLAQPEVAPAEDPRVAKMVRCTQRLIDTEIVIFAFI